MSVVGFDIGNENCVIAAAKQRGIDVLLNDESKRETPSVVSFGDKQRFLGSAGAASVMMNPKSTISQVKRLIGRNFNQADVQEELRRVPFETSGGSNGEILIHLQYMGETQTFTPVQILAMLFVHLKHTAEKNLETTVSDCVIGIPAYFTDFQRRAYLNAATIAGLKPLRLMHDSTATALGYGIYKSDFSGMGPTIVVFVDIGHCDTQVSVASFDTGQMRILSHSFDPNLGGRDFDEVLFNHFAAQFKEQYKIDVWSNVRASIRLRTACEKLKKVLSANAEAPINIECLMDEKDVSGFIKRDEFEQLSSGLLDRIAVTCQKALANLHLSVDKIHSVELVGSGSRIPAIVRMLADFFKRETSRTMNASECVARGCALQCAMLSPIFRVRDYEVQDSFPYSIGVASDEAPICMLSNNILFRKGQLIPSVKMLSFHRTNTFHLEAFYSDQSELPPSVCPKISCFKIGPFQAFHNENSKVKVKVKLSLHGIVTVESAWLIEDEVEDPVTWVASHSRSDEMEHEFNSKLSSEMQANGPENENNSYAKSESLRTAAVPSARDQHLRADGKRKGRQCKRVEIAVTVAIHGGMSEVELSEAQKKELQLAQQDRVMEQTKEKRNALESFIYETRDKLFDTLRSFATESEREKVSSSLQRTEEWLYEDGDDESEKVYAEKLEELKKMVDPIENRFRDDEARPQATRDLLKCIDEHRAVAKSLATSDRDAVNNECFKAEQWLQERKQLQDSLPKDVDPVLWSSEIKRTTEMLDMSCRQILRPMAFPARTEESEGTGNLNTDDNMSE